MNNTKDAMVNISFSSIDYTFFGIILGINVVIGIYFGIFKGQRSAKEYLFGGKQMSPIPVGISLVASSISGVTLLAVPSDVYKYGMGYWFACPVQIWVTIITYFVYLPVLYQLEIDSIFKYLKIRFNKKIQILASVLFTIANILFLPIVIYVPALAFSQATGISVHMITPLVCGICIFYTTIGGLKTVVWTDTLQFFIMIIALVTVFCFGVISTGGFAYIWKEVTENERLDISFEMDITKRETIWTCLFGMTFMWLKEISLNQEFVQKCLSLPTYNDVKRTMCVYAIGKVMMISFSVFTGLIIFARYSNCDPLTSGVIERADQLLPYYVTDVAGSIPGLPGLFIAGIFSAALSTLSALLNCLAGTIYNDFISPFMPKDIPQSKESLILKCLVVIIGVISTTMVFVIEKLGGILALTYSLSGVTSGAMVGIFSAGMLIPIVNSTGVLCGGTASLVIMAWIIFGRQWYENQGVLQYPMRPLHTDGCQNFTNISIASVQPISDVNPEDIFILYRISFYWYCLLGVAVTIIVSIIVSLFTKEQTQEIKKECFSPVIHFLLPKETQNLEKYHTIDHALNIIKTN